MPNDDNCLSASQPTGRPRRISTVSSLFSEPETLVDGTSTSNEPQILPSLETDVPYIPNYIISWPDKLFTVEHFDHHNAVDYLNKEYGKVNGYGITIDGTRKNKHNRVRKVKLRCACSKYRKSEATGVRNTDGKVRGVSTRKHSNCPWRANLILSRCGDWWIFNITVPEHTHPRSSSELGLPQLSKFDARTKSIIEAGTRAFDKPRQIIRQLDQLDLPAPRKMVTNYMEKVRRDELEGKSKVTALFEFLQDYTLNEETPEDPESKFWFRHTFDHAGRLHTLFWTHPALFEYIRATPEVIMLDCTYKTNRFGMPFLHIGGVTGLGKSFDIAWAFIPGEQEEHYDIAVGFLRELLRELAAKPSVFITDDEKALQKSLDKHFPNAKRRLCLWHLTQNVKKKAILEWNNKGTTTPEEVKANLEKRDAFIATWESLVAAKTEAEFNEVLLSLQLDGIAEEWEILPEYLEKHILPRKEYWAEYLCRSYNDFGERATSRLEGSHRWMKDQLMHLAHPYEVVRALHLHIIRWRIQHEAQVARDQSLVCESHRVVPEYLRLHYVISTKALKLIDGQLALAKDPTRYKPDCSGAFRAKYNLPCSHHLYSKLASNPKYTIDPYSVGQHWWYRTYRATLPRLPLVPQDPALVYRCRPTLQAVPQSSPAVSIVPESSLQQPTQRPVESRDSLHIERMVARQATYAANVSAAGSGSAINIQIAATMDPQVVQRKRGRPKGSKNGPRVAAEGTGNTVPDTNSVLLQQLVIQMSELTQRLTQSEARQTPSQSPPVPSPPSRRRQRASPMTQGSSPRSPPQPPPKRSRRQPQQPPPKTDAVPQNSYGLRPNRRRVVLEEGIDG